MTQRRPDESMELLNSITRESNLRPDEQHDDSPRGWRSVGVFLICAIAGAAMAASALTIGQARPQAVADRAEMAGRASAAEEENEQLRSEVEQLRAQTLNLRNQKGLGTDAQLRELESFVGIEAASGPGVVIELREGTLKPGKKETEESRVLDDDLQLVVNGLWQSGAQAIAINDHRVTTRTAIRQAGQAITVNYRSLTSPYKISAIGGQDLAANFANTSGGVLLGHLKQNYSIEWSLNTSDDLTLPADPGLALSQARPLAEKG